MANTSTRRKVGEADASPKEKEKLTSKAGSHGSDVSMLATNGIQSNGVTVMAVATPGMDSASPCMVDTMEVNAFKKTHMHNIIQACMY